MSVVRPRAQILINGQPLPSARNADGSLATGLVSATVETTNYARGDTFDATIAYQNMQPAPPWSDPPTGTTQVEATIQIGMLEPGASEGLANPSTMIVGLIDHVSIDPIAGLIQVTGRDYSSLLLDLRVTNGWQNETSGEVVSKLATQAGLSANIQSRGGLTGQYYQIGHKRSALTAQHRFANAWDLVQFLARTEGCDAYVTNKTLNFVPALSDSSPAVPVTMQRDANGHPILNVWDLKLERDLLMAKGVLVQVVSWNSKLRRTVTGQWPLKGTSATGASNKGQLYSFKRPNLTADQAQKIAHEYYNQVVAHQRTVRFEIPMDLALTPRQPVNVYGTGTSFDGVQRIDAISRTLSVDDVTQAVTLRNRDVTEDVEQ